MIEISFLTLLFKPVVEFARKPVCIVSELITKKCSRIYYHMFLSVIMWGALFLWEQCTSPHLVTWTWSGSCFGKKKKKVRGQYICHISLGFSGTISTNPLTLSLCPNMKREWSRAETIHSSQPETLLRNKFISEKYIFIVLSSWDFRVCFCSRVN